MTDSVQQAKNFVNSSGLDQTNIQLCIERGIRMSDLVGAVLMSSKGSESFDEELSNLLDDVAQTIGDFTGAASADPKIVIKRFGEVLMGAIADRLIENDKQTSTNTAISNRINPV